MHIVANRGGKWLNLNAVSLACYLHIDRRALLGRVGGDAARLLVWTRGSGFPDSPKVEPTRQRQCDESLDADALTWHCTRHENQRANH